MNLKVGIGSKVIVNIPDNPMVHAIVGTIEKLEEWGAHLISPKFTTGKFRALFSEIELVPENNALTVREQGYTGDACDRCNSHRMRRNGSCLLCFDCGSTSGCS